MVLPLDFDLVNVGSIIIEKNNANKMSNHYREQMFITEFSLAARSPLEFIPAGAWPSSLPCDIRSRVYVENLVIRRVSATSDARRDNGQESRRNPLDVTIHEDL